MILIKKWIIGNWLVMLTKSDESLWYTFDKSNNKIFPYFGINRMEHKSSLGDLKAYSIIVGSYYLSFGNIKKDK